MNTLYTEELYNPEVKEQFLEHVGEDSASTYERILLVAAGQERQITIDLFDMNLQELADVMYAVNPLTASSVRSIISYTRRYIDWAIEQGYTRSNINPLRGIDYKWGKQFIDYSKKLFLSEEELFDIEEDLVNGQDSFVLRALFCGLYGDGLSEILNLKMEDIKYQSKTIRLYDDSKGERELKFETEWQEIDFERLHSLAEEANSQDKYLNKNGTAENVRRLTSELTQSPFVIKPSKTRNSGEIRTSNHVIYRRLGNISEMFEIPYLTTKNIWKSGQIKMAKELLNRDSTNKLDIKHLVEIALRFNLVNEIDIEKVIPSKVYSMKDYINPRNLKELYDMDIEV